MTTGGRDNRALLLVLWLSLALAVFGALRADLTPAEAATLWTVRDVEAVGAGAPQEVARAIVANAREAFNRAGPLPFNKIYALALEGWTRLVGESLFTVRLFSALCTLLGLSLLIVSLRPFVGVQLAIIVVGLTLGFSSAALITARSATASAFFGVFFGLAAYLLARFVIRWRPQRHFRMGWLAVVVALCVGLAQGAVVAFGQMRTDWTTTSVAVLATRSPAEPALTDLDPRGPAGYTALQHGLKRGIAVDLAWRDPDPTLTPTLVEAATRGGGPLWVMMPRARAEAWGLPEALAAAGYVPETCLSADDTLFYRFVPGDEATCVF